MIKFPPPIPKSLFLPFFLILSLTNAVAQSDFTPGLIITHSNDTIRGFIDYKKNTDNATKCVFKKTLDAESRVYKPEDITGYRIDDSKFYIAKKVKGENLFLEFLVDGIVNLYYYKTNTHDYFFLERDTALIELSNEKVQFYGPTRGGLGETKYEKESNKYKGDLTYAFRDDVKIFPKIRAATFDDKSLMKLVKQYHEDVCTDQTCIVYTKANKTSIWIGPKISWVSASMGLQGSKDHVHDTQLSYGVQIQCHPSFLYYRWNIITGLEFSKQRFNGDFTGRYFDFTYDLTYHINLTYNTVLIPLIFQYTFPTKKIQPIFYFGINNTLLTGSNYNITQTVFNPSSRTYDTTPAQSDLGKYQIGILGGIGAIKNIGGKWSLNVKADYEYRFPAQNFRQTLDVQKIQSIIVSAGLLYKL